MIKKACIFYYYGRPNSCKKGTNSKGRKMRMIMMILYGYFNTGIDVYGKVKKDEYIIGNSKHGI